MSNKGANMDLTDETVSKLVAAIERQNELSQLIIDQNKKINVRWERELALREADEPRNEKHLVLREQELQVTTDAKRYQEIIDERDKEIYRLNEELKLASSCLKITEKELEFNREQLRAYKIVTDHQKIRVVKEGE